MKTLSSTTAEVQHHHKDNLILKYSRIVYVKYTALVQLFKILLTYRLFMLDFDESLSFKLDTFCTKNFVGVVKRWDTYDINITGCKIVSD